MARITRDDQQANLGSERNLQYSLSAKEKQSIVTGDFNWFRLWTITETLESYAKGRQVKWTESDRSSTTKIVDLAEEINSMIRGWIDGYIARNSPRVAILGFWYHWKIIRVWVSLQFRLAVEQVLYEKGDPWRQLVTGFGVVRDPK